MTGTVRLRQPKSIQEKTICYTNFNKYGELLIVFSCSRLYFLNINSYRWNHPFWSWQVQLDMTTFWEVSPDLLPKASICKERKCKMRIHFYCQLDYLAFLVNISAYLVDDGPARAVLRHLPENDVLVVQPVENTQMQLSLVFLSFPPPHQSALMKVMKNWEPFVSGPALAMERS